MDEKEIWRQGLRENMKCRWRQRRVVRNVKEKDLKTTQREIEAN